VGNEPLDLKEKAPEKQGKCRQKKDMQNEYNTHGCAGVNEGENVG